MNKSIFTLILILLTSLLTSCKEEEVLNYIDVNLFAGTWEVVESYNPERGCIYDITTSSDLSVNMDDGYHGQITTYYLTATGVPLHDKVYDWSILTMENAQPLLKLTLVDIPDDENRLSECYYYNITKLTSTHMWWRGNSDGHDAVIKL